MSTDHTPARVVVLGGGYAGTTAADRLRRRPDLDVTLINPRPLFVERIRLHQLAAGTHPATADYAPLLADGVRLTVGEARRIETADRAVALDSGARVPYDHLVYAVGSTARLPASVAGLRAHAIPIAELEAAHRLRDALAAADRGAPVTVVGGGLTGIETASELVEAGRRVRLVCATLGPSLSDAGRRSVARWCARRGVEVREGVEVAAVGPEEVALGDGTTLPSAVTVWAAGFGVPLLARDSGLATDDLGRLLTDETLTSTDDERIVAAGDAAAPSGRPLRMSCQAAGPLGAQAADAVLARLDGVAPRPIDQAFTGQAVSLGRRAATIQFSRRDDTPVPLVVGGRAGAVVKEALCRAALGNVRREARRPGASFWLRGGRR